MDTLDNRWLRANKDKVDNLKISKGDFRQIKETRGHGYYLLTDGYNAKADVPTNWTIMPENFHPNDPKELTGRYLLCVLDNNWTHSKNRPSRGEHVMIVEGNLGTATSSIKVKDILGIDSDMATDRLFGINPEYKLMAIDFNPNKVDARAYPKTPSDCFTTEPGKNYPIGCSIIRGDSLLTYKVIGKNSDGVIISTHDKVGFKVTEEHLKHYSMHPSFIGIQVEFLPYSMIKPHLPPRDTAYIATKSNIDPPVHSSKWEFPKGCVVDYGGQPYTVIGKSDNLPRYLLLSNIREGVFIRPDWIEEFHIDMIYKGRYGIWASKQELSFNVDSPQNKHQLAKRSVILISEDNTSLENDPVTRRVKPPKFQHKRTAY